MKKKFLYTLAFAAALALPAMGNTAQTVTSVVTSVTVADGIDYHITSTTPFGSSGKINLSSTSGSVIIFDHVRPASAVSFLSSNVTIDGEKAVKGTNCDLRLYANGAIVFPYTEKDEPLTVYSEQNFGGTAVSSFGLEDNGGFMNTLTEAKLNNKIRSFKLRRGYMVTFSTKAGGYGYSRCFVADDADLEFATLPKVLDQRISSYRIFKWTDASKKGLANDTRATTNDLLGTTSCYSFGNGENTGMDRECVRHHIKEGWPSIASVGENSYTTSNPTVKTNNEPGNSADDSPCTVDEVLANWEQLMATGKRLCSPSSHDGSLSWLRNFMDSIDARGWRCDVLDMHCYWPEGSFSGLASWYNSYKRPIWVSEWVWGASWNKNGAFSTGYTDDQAKAENAKVIKRLIDKMEGWDYVERYFYWNSEADRSKLVINGELTAAGEQYAALESKVGFKRSLAYVPKGPRMSSPTNFAYAFVPKTSTCTLTWTDTNGEYNDSIFIERKIGEGFGTKWVRIATVEAKENSNSYSYKDITENAGKYFYRIHTIDYNGKEHYSSELLNSISGTTGTDDVQWGTYSANSTEENYNFYETSFTEEPVIVFGSTTDENSGVTAVERIVSAPMSNKKYAFFSAQFFPWNSSKDVATMSKSESTSYIVAKQGNGTLGKLAYEAGLLRNASGNEMELKNDTLEYKFTKPFSTTPVVFATPADMQNLYPVTARVWDVTTDGFKVILTRQKAMDAKTFYSTYVYYFAIEQGETSIGNKRFEVKDTTLTFASKTAEKEIAYQEKAENPLFLTQLQSFNRKVTAVAHTSLGPDNSSCYVGVKLDTSEGADNTISAKSPMTETFGWMLISDDDDPTGISAPKAVASASQLDLAVSGGQLRVNAEGASSVMVYAASGATVARAQLTDGQASIDLSQLPAGILIVKTSTGAAAKVVIGR